MELVPETADTYTAGFVWTPDFGNTDLSVTVDWWSIEVDDAISSFGVNYILDQCYLEGDATQCALIDRRNDTDFTIRGIVDSNVNVAAQTGEGVDLEVRYGIDAGAGEFQAALLWSHMLERTKTPRPGELAEDLEGLHTNVTAEDGGTYAEDKINFSLHWYRGSFSVGYLAEYISSIEAPTQYLTLASTGLAYYQSIDSYLYHDVVFNYDLNQIGNTRLTLGITNISDEDPPYIDGAFNANTDPNTYRMFGMGYFFRISQTFE
jgi:outer membrane receptor protein involved in Fe transport